MSTEHSAPEGDNAGLATENARLQAALDERDAVGPVRLRVQARIEAQAQRIAELEAMLRKAAGYVLTDHIDAQDKRIEEMEAALRPFVFGGPLADVLFGGMPDTEKMTTTTTLGDFRRARAALKQD